MPFFDAKVGATQVVVRYKMAFAVAISGGLISPWGALKKHEMGFFV
jgi:hypothetical protein